METTTLTEVSAVTTASATSPEAITAPVTTDAVEAALPRSRSESLKAYWADPAHRDQHAEKMKANWASSEKNVALAKKRSVQIRDQNGVEYESVNDAARKLSLHASNIRAHLKGRVKHVRGFTFTTVTRPDGH